VIQGLSISNTRLVVWANGQGVLVGASVAMSLEQPATIEGEWRGISWMDSSKTKYGVTVYNAKLSNVKTVDVWVDLGKGAVVGWSANSDAKVETGSVIIATPAAQ